MSNVESTSLRGKGSSFMHWTDKWVNTCLLVSLTEFWLCSLCDIWLHTSDAWPLENLLFHLLSTSRWQQWEWEWLWRQVQRWVTTAFIGKGQELEFFHSCFSHCLCKIETPEFVLSAKDLRYHKLWAFKHILMIFFLLSSHPEVA